MINEKYLMQPSPMNYYLGKCKQATLVIHKKRRNKKEMLRYHKTPMKNENK